MHWLDPSALPSVTGRVAQYTINVRGDVDGMLLDDHRQIHVPPHMGAAVAKLVGIGDTIEARYVKPRGAPVFAAISVSDAKGKTLVDNGPAHRHGPHGHPPRHESVARKAMHIEGCVRTTLFAPKGEVCGAVLEDGTQIRIDPKANAELADYFAKDARIQVWGEGLKRRNVTVVDVHEIAFAHEPA